MPPQVTSYWLHSCSTLMNSLTSAQALKVAGGLLVLLVGSRQLVVVIISLLELCCPSSSNLDGTGRGFWLCRLSGLASKGRTLCHNFSFNKGHIILPYCLEWTSSYNTTPYSKPGTSLTEVWLFLEVVLLCINYLLCPLFSLYWEDLCM